MFFQHFDEMKLIILMGKVTTMGKITETKQEFKMSNVFQASFRRRRCRPRRSERMGKTEIENVAVQIG